MSDQDKATAKPELSASMKRWTAIAMAKANRHPGPKSAEAVRSDGVIRFAAGGLPGDEGRNAGPEDVIRPK